MVRPFASKKDYIAVAAGVKNCGAAAPPKFLQKLSEKLDIKQKIKKIFIKNFLLNFYKKLLLIFNNWKLYTIEL